MRVYISGPMTGIAEFNAPAFNAAEGELRTLGLDTVNPARLGVIADATWQTYMRIDLADLMLCDAVATLDGWAGSPGARLEVHVATALGMTVLPVSHWAEATS